MHIATARFSPDAGWSQPEQVIADSASTAVFVFGDSALIDDPGPIAELVARYPSSQVIGCSTSGHILNDQLADVGLTCLASRFEASRLASGRMASAEALVRWQHPDGRLVSPGVFVTVAEEMGIIGELGRWVLNDACRQVAAWNRSLSPERQICVGVNVSRRQILDADLVADVRGALGASGLEARRLNIEITESIIMSDSRRAARVLDAIRETGVRVLMDDFGTGYSSLSCLHNFSVDGLKIDRSFVELLQSEGPYRAVVETIVRLAHVLEKRVVCEGIETPEQLQIVRELGCDFAQGFLFSRPVPGAEMERLLLAPGGAVGLAA